MNKFKFGSIYKLVSKETEKFYIGSTVNGYERLNQHKRSYINSIKNETERVTDHNRCAYQILKYEDCNMYIIENFPCNNEFELRSREREWIIKLGNPLNQQLPYDKKYIINKGNEKASWKRWYKNYGTDLKWFNDLSKNSLQIFPKSKEEIWNTKRRYKKIWYNNKKKLV